MREWILERWQVYARVLLMVAVFLPPVIFDRRTVDVFNLLKVTVLWAAGLAAAALWIAWSAERGVWMPRIRLGYAAAAFLAACALATVFSGNPALSLIGLYHRYGGLLPFTLYALITATIVGVYWERPGDLKEVARASAAASVLMAAYVLIQAAGLDWIEWRDASGGPPEFPVGTMGNSNFAGAYLGIAVPFLVYAAAAAKRDIVRTMLIVVAGLDLLSLWLTQTRGGMIAAAAGLGLMAFLYRELLPRWVRLGALAGAAATVLVAAVLLADVGSARTRGPLARIETLRTGTFVIRTYYWGTAWRIFADNAVLGTGLETYYANYPRYRLAKDGAELGLTITDKPHNIYLEYAANSGILGLGAYLALVGWGLALGYRRCRRLPPKERLLPAAFTAVLAGYLAQGFFSIDVPPLAVMGWVGLAGVVAFCDPRVLAARERMLARSAEGKARARNRKRKGERSSRESALRAARSGPTLWPVHAVLLAGATALVVVGVRPLLADAKAKAGQTSDISKRPPEEVVARYEEAIRLHRLEPAYRTLAGSIAERQASDAKDSAAKQRLLARALGRYREAYALQPGNVFYMMNIARIHTTWGESVDPARFAEADRWWKRAADHDPTDWDVQNRYALMLNSWANAVRGDPAIRRRSAEQLEKVTRIRPEFVPAWINLGKIYRVLGEPVRAEAALRRALALEPRNEEARNLLAEIEGRDSSAST